MGSASFPRLILTLRASSLKGAAYRSPYIRFNNSWWRNILSYDVKLSHAFSLALSSTLNVVFFTTIIIFPMMHINMKMKNFLGDQPKFEWYKLTSKHYSINS